MHLTVFSLDGKYLFVQELGADKIFEYPYTPDGTRGLIGPIESRYTIVPPGTGPRHMVSRRTAASTSTAITTAS